MPFGHQKVQQITALVNVLVGAVHSCGWRHGHFQRWVDIRLFQAHGEAADGKIFGRKTNDAAPKDVASRKTESGRLK